jgi:hypothetical protein
MAQRQQNVSEPIPPFFIRQLTGMEASVTSALAAEKEKASGKKMNATNAKALTAMRQKIKKTMKEYEKDVKRFQEVCSPHIMGKFLVSYRVRTPKRSSASTRRQSPSRRCPLPRRRKRRQSRLKKTRTLRPSAKAARPCSSPRRVSSRLSSLSRRLAVRR